MRAMLAIAHAVLADAIRRKVVWVVLLFAAVLVFTVPSLPSYGQGVASSVYREVSLALMFVASLIAALALAATRVPGEVERRTVFTVLARDVRRWQYLTGTWAGIFTVVGLVLLAFCIVAIVTGWVVYREPMPVLLEGALAIWLEAGVVTALTLLVSTRASAVTSVAAALAFVFIGHSISSVAGDKKWLVPSLDAFNVINPVSHGGGYDVMYAVTMTAVFIVWCATLLTAATLLFEGRDL